MVLAPLSDFVAKSFFVGLHPPLVRDSFLMRKQFKWAAPVILAALVASLASCQSSGGGVKAGNSTSNEDVTDPNFSFTHPATRNENP